MSPRVERVLLGLLLAAVALLHGLTLRPGFDWGGDWAQYLEHARNLAEGRPYDELNYLFNPDGSAGPPAYPPVYPILMAPLVKVFGTGLAPFQLQSVAFLVLFLWLFYRTWRPHVPAAPLLAAMAAFALHPYVWGCKDLLLSEFPFLCFVQGALWALDRAPERGGRRLGLIAGFLLALAAGTRAAGLALLPLPLLFSFWKHRRASAWVWAATGAAAAGIGILAALFGTFWRYGDYFRPSLSTVAYNVSYGIQWLAQLAAGPPAVIQWALFFVLAAAAVLGAINSIRHRTPHELYGLFLLAPLLIYPSNQGLRYILPLLPCLFLYVALAFGTLAPNRAGRAIVAVTVGGLLWAYGAVYARSNFKAHVPGSVAGASTAELLKALKEHTAADAVFATSKPRALAFLARRRAFFLPSDDARALAGLERFRAGFLLASPAWVSDRAWLLPFIQRHEERFRPVFKNKDFLLFAVKHQAEGTGPH
jgi:4-amino-4-deoxy-L-arabinose transferase-like glycosyltransferase